MCTFLHLLSFFTLRYSLYGTVFTGYLLGSLPLFPLPTPHENLFISKGTTRLMQESSTSTLEAHYEPSQRLWMESKCTHSRTLLRLLESQLFHQKEWIAICCRGNPFQFNASEFRLKLFAWWIDVKDQWKDLRERRKQSFFYRHKTIPSEVSSSDLSWV